MSPVISVIGTLLVAAILIFSLYKKAHAGSALFVIGLASMLIYSIATGNSIMGDATSGNVIIDVFEKVSERITNTFTVNGIITVTVIGYVSWMDKMKASKVFAAMCAKPLKKVKAKGLLIVLAFIVILALKMIIVNGMGVIAMCIGTIYPILLACGISNATAAVTMLIANCSYWLLVNNQYMIQQSVAGLSIDAMQYFVKFNTPVELTVLLVQCIIIMLTYKYFDKKEKYVEIKGEDVEIEPRAFGVPLWYGLLPLLPLSFLIIFSSLGIKSVKISIAGAHILAFVISYVINIIRSKDKKDAFLGYAEWFKYQGNTYGTVLGVMIGGRVFAEGIICWGGVTVMFNTIMQSSSGVAILGCASAVFMFAISWLTGAPAATMPMFSAMFAELFMAGTITEINVCMLHAMMSMGAFCGIALSPVLVSNVFIHEQTNTPYPIILKRALPPTVGGLIAGCAVAIILFF